MFRKRKYANDKKRKGRSNRLISKQKGSSGKENKEKRESSEFEVKAIREIKKMSEEKITLENKPKPRENKRKQNSKK